MDGEEAARTELSSPGREGSRPRVTGSASAVPPARTQAPDPRTQGAGSPVPGSPGARQPVPAPKARPNAWPSRVVMGVGGVAAMSVITAGLVRFPTQAAVDTTAVEEPAPTMGHQRVVHRVQYVQLRRGQKAPAGAKVIRGADPTPRVIVQTVPIRPRVVRQRTVVRTRQSGRP